MADLHRVFVYGTLKKGEPNHHLLTNGANGYAKFVGRGKTATRWPLVIASKYNIPFLLLKEGYGNIISGEVYDVDDKMLVVLDALEEHPTFYERLEYDIILEGHSNEEPKTTKCWIYFIKKYKHFMLELPTMGEYSSKGSHGLEYILRYRRLPVDGYNLVEEILTTSTIQTIFKKGGGRMKQLLQIPSTYIPQSSSV